MKEEALKALAVVCDKRIEEASSLFVSILDQLTGPLIEEVERWKQVAIQKAEMDAIRIDEALCCESESESEVVLSESTELNYLQLIAENITIFRDNLKSLPHLFHKAVAQDNVTCARLLLHPFFGIDPFAGSYSAFRYAFLQGYADIFRMYMEMPDFDIRSVPNLSIKKVINKKQEGNLLPLFGDSYFISLINSVSEPPLFTACERGRVILYICQKGDSELLKKYVTPSSNENFDWEYGVLLTSASVAEVLLQNWRLKNDVTFCSALARFSCRTLSTDTTISLFSQILDFDCLMTCLFVAEVECREKTDAETIISFLIHKCLGIEIFIDGYGFRGKLRTIALKFRCISAIKRMVADRDFDFGCYDSFILREYVNRGDTELVALLMESPTVDPSALNNEALLLAIKRKDAVIATLLLRDSRVDPSARDNLALYLAMRGGLIKLALTILNDPRVKPDREIFHAAVVDAKLRGFDLAFMERLLIRFA
jgi:hypothetical protein